MKIRARRFQNWIIISAPIGKAKTVKEPKKKHSIFFSSVNKKAENFSMITILTFSARQLTSRHHYKKKCTSNRFNSTLIEIKSEPYIIQVKDSVISVERLQFNEQNLSVTFILMRRLYRKTLGLRPLDPPATVHSVPFKLAIALY